MLANFFKDKLKLISTCFLIWAQNFLPVNVNHKYGIGFAMIG